MKKISLLLCIMYLGVRASAQVYDSDVDSAFATFLKGYLQTHDSLDTFELENYERLHDSIGVILADKDISKIVMQNGPYPWPSRAIAQYPGDTYQYLLHHQYNFTAPLSSGCIDQSIFRIYDSLMADALKKRYGQHFFKQSRHEAERLDSQGLGLILPELKRGKAPLYEIANAIRKLDSIIIKNSGVAIELLLLRFDKGKLVGAYVGRRYIWGVGPINEVEVNDELLLEPLQKLPWTGPTFKGKRASCTVVADLEAQKWYFDQLWSD